MLHVAAPEMSVVKKLKLMPGALFRRRAAQGCLPSLAAALTKLRSHNTIELYIMSGFLRSMMESLTPRYSKAEFAQRGDEIYKHDIRPQVSQNDEGKFVVIDIETRDYEIDSDEIVASDRLLSRHPGAQVWVSRVGSPYARRFGASRRLMKR